MEEKKSKKTVVIVIMLIIAIIAIVVMGIFIYKLNDEKISATKKVDDLNAQLGDLQSKMNMVQENNNNSSSGKTINSNNSTAKLDNTQNNDIKYEITKKNDQSGNEVIALIKATKDGKSVTKEFKMEALIANTGTMSFPTIGSVALVAESGGESYNVNVYQLVNGDIKKLGTINCGADMAKETTYTVETKGEATAVITAKRNGEITKKEFEMSAAIAKTEVIDILNLGKVVLVAETGGEYYAFKVYRLSKDYNTNKTVGIVEVGTIQYLF